MNLLLQNYLDFRGRVDLLCNNITAALGEQLSCRDGCSHCCKQITIFPVEAASLKAYFTALPESQRAVILQHLANHTESETCPLLKNHRCLIYQARPIICRTHGLPLLYKADDGEPVLDYCRLNKIKVERLSGADMIDLEKLNLLLVAINRLFVSQSADIKNERLKISEIF